MSLLGQTRVRAGGYLYHADLSESPRVVLVVAIVPDGDSSVGSPLGLGEKDQALLGRTNSVASSRVTVRLSPSQRRASRILARP